MLWLAMLAIASAEGAPTEEPVVQRRQAQAVVRVLRAATIQLGEGIRSGEGGADVRRARVSDGDGATRPAILVEFS